MKDNRSFFEKLTGSTRIDDNSMEEIENKLSNKMSGMDESLLGEPEEGS